MSTVPGHESWQDAGLATPALAEVVVVDADLLEDVSSAGPAQPDPEEYEPDRPAPELRGDADEADLAAQLADVPADEQDDYR